jgi:hypothetical protein
MSTIRLTAKAQEKERLAQCTDRTEPSAVSELALTLSIAPSSSRNCQIAVLPDDARVKRAWSVLHDSLSSLVYPAQHVGFYVGVFVGAKFQGASRDTLYRNRRGANAPLRAAMGTCAVQRGIHSEASQGKRRQRGAVWKDGSRTCESRR